MKFSEIGRGSFDFSEKACKLYEFCGEMVEWFKAAVLKTAVGFPHRGFESRSLRHLFFPFQFLVKRESFIQKL